ncbi:MAG: DUF433 domain-containing protein [Planctomycetes bacterium]|nr:DUF433 domain-containing protein [Planctomycetota bacterium]
MVGEITLIDRGRGLQLPKSRITVMDLVQYFRHNWSYDEIIKNIPSLTHAEIAVVEAYYREHKEELDEKDRQVDAYREEQARLQAIRFPIPDETREEKLARFRKLLQKRQQEKNGEGNGFQ